ncbi:MAG: acetylornithine deacetylase [Labrys sp. (in: a-proteobacteria)]
MSRDPSLTRSAPRYTPAELTDRLIRFPTVSDRTNLPLIEFVADYLAAHGIESVRLPNATGDKAALFATIGPTDRPGVCLSGHVDVVPVEGQAWSMPAFEPRLADGRLYGRGSCDMKGFVATALALVPEFKSARLSAPIHLALSYDEEITCLGSLDMIARFGVSVPHPIACIVGEPTSMRVVDAHKSAAGYEVIVTGRPAHSALPHLGANAIHAAARLIVELETLGEELTRRGDPSGRFDPACSTLQVGQIEGGEAINIVPARTRFTFDLRGLPTLDRDEIPGRLAAFSRDTVEPRLRATAPEAMVEISEDVFVPALGPEPGSIAETLALRCAGQNGTETVSYVTEAGHFQAAGIPTVVCGPGSITQAHRADEFVALSELEACAAFLRRLAASLA